VGGDIGSPTAVTGFAFPAIDAANGIYTGFMNLSDTVTAQGTADINSKETALKGMTCDTTDGSLQTTYSPGVHCISAAVVMTTGTVTLDAGGDPTATFVFLITGALTVTGSESGGGEGGDPHILLINGAQKSNVYWVPIGSGATFTNAQFVGNVIADAAITLTSSNIQGRVLTTSVTLGAVTLTTSTVNAS
jgi:hypothetical protein